MKNTNSGNSCLGWMKPRRHAWLNDPTHYRGTRVYIVGFLLGIGEPGAGLSMSYEHNLLDL